MLKATQVELFLQENDLASALINLAAGQAERLEVRCTEGALLISLSAGVEAVRLTFPVDLRLTVRSVRAGAVEFDVDWTNMAAVPWALKNMVLNRAFGQLPGHYDDGLYTLPVAQLLDELPVEFRLHQVAFTADGCRITLADVALFPVLEGVVAVPAMVPAPSKGEQEPPEHQDYYRKLREQIRSLADRNLPRWAQPFVPWVLAIPDFFVLVARLAVDPRVPGQAKVLAGAAVLYFISPLDIIPDIVPVMGQVDDIAMALFALDSIGKTVRPEVFQELWPGEGDVLKLVASGLKLFTEALPKRVLLAIHRWLRRSSKGEGGGR